MAWMDNLSNGDRAYAANKGWDRLEGDALAQAMFKSYQNLESSRPDPAKTLTIPDPTDVMGLAQFHQRLGVPATPADYKFDGIDAETELTDSVRAMAHAAHLTQAQANDMLKGMVGMATAQETAAVDRVRSTTEALKTAWGADYDAKVAIASNAFEALKWPKESVDALIASLGVDGTMKLGHELGSRMGEGSFHTGDGHMPADNKPALTREQAMYERNRLMNDTAFAAKVVEGDVESLKKLEDLAKAMVGTPENWSAVPENFGRTRENPLGDPAFQARNPNG